MNNKTAEAIGELKKKIEPKNGRWVIMGIGVYALAMMVAQGNSGHTMAAVLWNFVASLAGVGFLAINLQAVFIKPILEILEKAFEDDGTGDQTAPPAE